MLIAAMFNVGGWVSSVHGKIMEESKILSDEAIESAATHEENQHWKNRTLFEGENIYKTD
jgi:hypothetical protein